MQASSKSVRLLLAARDSAQQRPKRILVAEDDLEMRTLVAEALWRDGYDVLSVGDGGSLVVQVSEQLDHPESGAFDLIISDVRMPVTGGMAVLEALRRVGCNVAVIVMTAFGDEFTRRRVHELGAVFFEKPFALDDLRHAVSALVPHKE